jgi:hypothetical protein
MTSLLSISKAFAFLISIHLLAESRKSNVFLILTPGVGLAMACPIYADG